jgi:prepilin signal peptidase PulO-like enzyme (type II secretory pathway)
MLFAYFNASNMQTLEVVLHLAAITVLICHFFIDLEHYLLLDKLNILLMLILITHQFMFTPIEWIDSVFGLIVGGAVPYFIAWGYLKYSGNSGLGGGDIKLFAVLGLRLGVHGIFENLFLSSILGILAAIIMMIVKRESMRKRPIPFGPAIIVAYLIQIYVLKNNLRMFE